MARLSTVEEELNQARSASAGGADETDPGAMEAVAADAAVPADPGPAEPGPGGPITESVPTTKP
jgi:hypothetical protein